MNQATDNRRATPRIRGWASNRQLLYQFLVIAAVTGFAYYLFSNAQANLNRQSIATGFGFLSQEAGFDIGETVVEYSAGDTYRRALIAGACNTLKVSFIGIILSVTIGTLVGMARISGNWLVSTLASAYVESLRNVPLLLQLFFLYALATDVFPHPREALSPITGVFLTNRGLYFGIPAMAPAYKFAGIAFLITLAALMPLRYWARRYRDNTGKILPINAISALLCIGVPLIVWILGGAPREMDVPELRGFNFRGGASISPEFGALLLGLVLYTSAFVAEVVRSGIESVNKGQTEAAVSLGLKRPHVLNLVVLPQAMRVIVPPLTNQMLNLTKNSSLAVGIGYPDFVSTANTTINQTGQAIEGVGLILALYLFFSLVTSFIMNWYNKRIALVER